MEIDNDLNEWNEWSEWAAWVEWDEENPEHAKKVFRYKKIDPLEYYNEVEFRTKFGFSKSNFKRILKKVEDDLNGPKAHAKHSLTATSKLAIFLYVARSNSLQR